MPVPSVTSGVVFRVGTSHLLADNQGLAEVGRGELEWVELGWQELEWRELEWLELG